MSWAHVAAAAVIMVVLQASLPLLPPRAAAEDLNGSCDGVECGRGSCRVSPNRTFGFVCDCEPGWMQLRVDDLLRFLPCVIPNCTFSYSCYNDSMAEPAPSIPAPPSLSLLDPCLWSYCGGGTCIKMSGFMHRCECKNGFSNLLNVTSFPCFKDCAVGADCVNLGLTVSNGSFPPSPTNFSNGGGCRASSSQKNLLWFILATSLATVQATWI